MMYKDESVQVYWNNEKDAPESIVDRKHWTESFVQWSPLGTYLTSMHQQGVQLWGGPSWTRQKRFAHPFVNMVAFSPNENYMVSWSNRPISIPDEGHPSLSLDDDGKNYVIWDVKTSKPLRSSMRQVMRRETASSSASSILNSQPPRRVLPLRREPQ